MKMNARSVSKGLAAIVVGCSVVSAPTYAAWGQWSPFISVGQSTRCTVGTAGTSSFRKVAQSLSDVWVDFGGGPFSYRSVKTKNHVDSRGTADIEIFGSASPGSFYYVPYQDVPVNTSVFHGSPFLTYLIVSTSCRVSRNDL